MTTSDAAAPRGAELGSGDAAWTAVERLVASREHLRVALLQAAEPARATSQAAGGSGGEWFAGLATLPGVAVVVDALRGWWVAHPWRPGARLAWGAAQAVVKPVAQRHPVGLVVAALVLGGLIAWGRPWRWAFRAGVLGGLGSHLFTRTLKGLPWQAWLAAWSSPPSGPAPGTVPPA